jgi:signal transduction histidine kinase
VAWGKARAARPAGAAFDAVSEVDFWRNFASSSSPELVLRPDSPTFSVAFVNEAYLRATGSDSQHVIDQPVRSVSPMQGSPGEESLEAQLERVLSGGVGNAMPVRPYRRPRAGRAGAGFDELFFTAQNAPLVSSDGQLSYVLHRLLDVTAVVRWAAGGEAREEVERLLLARTAALAAAERELDALSYSISHDLRAPLRAIDGFSEALSIDHAEALDEQGQHYLGRVRAGVARMSQLLDDLLGLSRIHRAPLRHAQVDLSALGRGVVADLRAREPGREVLVQIADGMIARGDGPLLGILLEHLLGNAWKFTSKAPSAEISFFQEQAPGQLRFCIQDNGVGFDMAYVNRLFAPFQRLHQATEFDGRGIGLAIVDRIVARHGGSVSVEAAVGKGARASFTLGEGASRAR